jgi:hypothetical protein
MGEAVKRNQPQGWITFIDAGALQSDYSVSCRSIDLIIFIQAKKHKGPSLEEACLRLRVRGGES